MLLITTWSLIDTGVCPSVFLQGRLGQDYQYSVEEYSKLSDGEDEQLPIVGDVLEYYSLV